MAKRLTDAIVMTAPPGRYYDEHGLILRVQPTTGARNWVWRGTVRGRRVDRGLGTYPDTSLEEARRKAFENRRLARAGDDPPRTRAPRQAVATRQREGEGAMGETQGASSVEDLLDHMMRLLEEAEDPSSEVGIAREVASQLVDREEDWEKWIAWAEGYWAEGDWVEGDYLSWLIVQELVAYLREHDLERLKRPPLFDWVLDVALDICPEPPRPKGGDWRLSRYRHLLITAIVRGIKALPTNSLPIWRERGGSICHLVADRTGLSPTTVREIVYKRGGRVRPRSDPD